jgi:hypothetical protein
MTKDLHDDALVNALGEEQGSSRVPGVVYAHLADTSRFEQGPPLVPVGVGADWVAVGLGPDEIAFLPR